jgi:uncharacterized membrane protein
MIKGIAEKHKWLILVLVCFGAIFAATSFLNHYNFRTYGWDLGINQNAIFDYAHFRWNDCMIMQPSFDNVLADHFSLYPLLISPFYWVFGSYTMLIFQWSAILFGGIGIYKFVFLISDHRRFATLATVHFFCIWGIYSALSFDYHDNVVAAMFVPWFLYYYKKEALLKSVLFFVLILISKENMALWAGFIGLGLSFRHLINKEWKRLKISSAMMIGAFLYFILILKVVIPSLSNTDGVYLHHSFNALGGNFGEVIVNIIKHPIRAIELLFENHSGDSYYDGIKAETYLAIILAGGWALVFYPEYLIMIVPILAQKMYNDLPIRWGISDHYSIEFVPIIVIALYTFLNGLENKKLKLTAVMVGICAVSTFKFMENRTSEYYKKDNTRFYAPVHWGRNFDVENVHQVLATIPDSLRVSAQAPLAPHLAFRDYIYHYPYKGDANCIALLTAEENKYPFNEVTYQEEIDRLLNSGEWNVFAKTPALLILTKK